MKKLKKCMWLQVLVLCISIAWLIADTKDVRAKEIVSGDWKYETYPGFEDEVYIKGYLGTDTNVTIPNSIDGATVVGIGELAFYERTDLTNVTIPSSVNHIGLAAFEGCTGLTDITIPSSVTFIEMDAFRGCSGLININIPDGISSITDSMFEGCSSLKSIAIPSSVTNFEWRAFADCSGLTSITIPSGVTNIGDYAFFNCSSLTSLVVPSSVTSIGGGAFFGCSGLTSVEIPFGVTSIEEQAFQECSGLTSVTIPESVTKLGWQAFSSCSGLTSITLPSGITNIEKYTFFGCSRLTSITIPSSVTSIGEYAFCKCSSLASIVIPEGIVSIPEHLFNGCSGLTSVTIPASVTTIDKYAFYGLKNVVIYLYAGSYAEEYAKSKGIPYVYLDGSPVGGGNENNYGEQTTPTPVEVFRYTVLDNGTVEITGLKEEVEENDVVELVIPSEINGKAVTSIGDSAFFWCSSIGCIELPEGITSIGSYAFHNCNSLENITIPSTLTIIEASAFSDCASLTSVYYSGTMEQWRTLEKEEENQCLDYVNIYCSDDTVEAKEFGYTVLEDGTIEINQAKSVEELVIPSELDGKRVTRVGENAFCHCKILKKVTIPDSVTSIEANAFYGCSNLSEITVPDTLTDIGGDAFAETAWMEAQRAKNPLVILNGVLIDGCAASGEVTVPDSVSVIGRFAFENCENLTGILLPDSVTSIEYYAFSHCNSLKNITFSDSITSIAAEAFRECISLKNITIPDSVESIGECAFVICSDLEYVTIPDSVTNLDKSAFANCFNLKEVYYSGTKTQWSAMSIADTDSSLVHTDIHCKDGIIEGREYAYRVLEDGTLEFIGNKDKNAVEVEVPAEIDGKTVTKIAEGAFYHYSALKSLKIPDTITVIGGWILGFNEIDTIYYSGTEEQWKAIEFGYWNGVLHGDVQYNAYVPGTGNNTEQTNPDNINNPAPTALSKITLSKSEAVYNGKAQTPTVTVVDANGQPVDAANYTVTYSNNQNVGQATVSVTGKNTYTGTVTATFNIIPKGTTISKVTAKKKAFTVKWKKQAKETTGYEVQYSTSKKFKDAKTTTVKKSKTTSATVKKLKAKKKYYVRIRTYKTVKINGKSTKLYSDWSKAKTTKVK